MEKEDIGEQEGLWGWSRGALHLERGGTSGLEQGRSLGGGEHGLEQGDAGTAAESIALFGVSALGQEGSARLGPPAGIVWGFAGLCPGLCSRR